MSFAGDMYLEELYATASSLAVKDARIRILSMMFFLGAIGVATFVSSGHAQSSGGSDTSSRRASNAAGSTLSRWRKCERRLSRLYHWVPLSLFGSETMLDVRDIQAVERNVIYFVGECLRFGCA